MSKLPEYIRTDERQDVIETLEVLEENLAKVESHDKYWKWIIQQAHSALFGSIVCTITQTHGVGALSEKSQKEFFEAYEKSRLSSKEEFINFRSFLAPPMELWKRN